VKTGVGWRCLTSRTAAGGLGVRGVRRSGAVSRFCYRVDFLAGGLGVVAGGSVQQNGGGHVGGSDGGRVRLRMAFSGVQHAAVTGFARDSLCALVDR
jgi:hypothetical protein